MAGVGAPCTWVLSNHDVDRHPTRYDGGAIGLARARAATLVQLSLPGAVFVYNGEELGLENVELPDSALQDPIWARSGHAERGRDGERVPMPWGGDTPPFEFGSGPTSWLPMPAEWKDLTVSAEADDPGSMLSFYRQALALRRATPALHTDEFNWLDMPSGALAYSRGPRFVVVLNTGDAPIRLPVGEVVVSSGPLTTTGELPTDTAVWLAS
jgi:alpha-glucosidase